MNPEEIQKSDIHERYPWMKGVDEKTGGQILLWNILSFIYKLNKSMILKYGECWMGIRAPKANHVVQSLFVFNADLQCSPSKGAL